MGRSLAPLQAFRSLNPRLVCNPSVFLPHPYSSFMRSGVSGFLVLDFGFERQVPVFACRMLQRSSQSVHGEPWAKPFEDEDDDENDWDRLRA